jgi:guanine nucleotide-binding protein G(i) subunit alpha
MFDVSGQRSGRRKWIHQFENVIGIIYFVDLGCYNEMNLEDEDSPQNRLMESLNYFAKTVVNSRWFTRSSIILFLSNMGSFREKLRRYPLSDYCPDYTGGNDINKATKYILYRFRSVNRHTNIYPHLCEATDHRAIRLVYAAVQDTVILQNLSNFLGAVIDGKETVEERNNNDQEAMKDCDVNENLERETEVDDGKHDREERQTMTEQDIAPDESECQ